MEIWAVLTAAAAAAVATELLTRHLADRLRRVGVTGVDVHKSGRPEVPEMVGAALALGMMIGASILGWADQSLTPRALAFSAAVGVASVIGAVDDLVDLNALQKALGAALIALPLLAPGIASPRPFLPLVGRARMHLALIALIPAFISVIVNSANMIDALNGLLVGSAAVISATMAAVGAWMGMEATAALSAVSAAACAAYYRHNRFPAEVFSGNVGSFALGAALGSASTFDGLESLLLISALPMIVSGYMTIVSIRGLKSRTEIEVKATVLEEGDRIRANPDPRAPITLIPVIALDRAKTERRIVAEIIALTVVSSALGTISLLVLTPTPAR